MPLLAYSSQMFIQFLLLARQLFRMLTPLADPARRGSGGIGYAKTDAYDIHESPIPVLIAHGLFFRPEYGGRVRKNRNIFHSENA